MKSKFVIFLFLFARIVLSQQTKAIELCFSSFYGAEKFVLNDSTSFVSEHDSIEISSLKFYCSNITFFKSGKKVWEVKNSHHLIDISEPTTSHLKLQVPNDFIYDELRFNLGIDSITNEMGAMGGDLDPINGMYWAWNSGYINFKLEGKSKKCNTRNNEFQFHIGGYAYPFNSLQSISIPVNNEEIINVNLNVNSILLEINLAEENHIMSPSPKAMVFAQKISKSFSTK